MKLESTRDGFKISKTITSRMKQEKMYELSTNVD
jgi:hypothetical protein